jgi:TPR repeat protein
MMFFLSIQGHPKAACRVADMCYSGKGVGVDYELAVTYYEQARHGWGG